MSFSTAMMHRRFPASWQDQGFTQTDDGDARDMVTYQLVERLVRSLVRVDARQFQFQLRLIPPRTEADESMAVVTSPAQIA